MALPDSRFINLEELVEVEGADQVCVYDASTGFDKKTQVNNLGKFNQYFIGFMGLSLSNFESDEGSLVSGPVETGGKNYVASGVSITDSASTGKVYLECVIVSNAVTFRWVNTQGTFDDALNGIYNGIYRQVGEGYKYEKVGDKRMYKNEFEAFSFDDSFLPGTSVKKIGVLNGTQNWSSNVMPLQIWQAATYGNGLFVAVASSGAGNRVATSPDGYAWTSRTSAADNTWNSVTYGNGLFVAVSQGGVGNNVMTSPDGITWTSRTSAADLLWEEVRYGNGLFVAVARSGTGNRVMTSPDGITWTSRTSAADNQWNGLTYGNGLFVAVAQDGTGDRVMTSPDGITWTIRTSAADKNWLTVAYGNGLFVAASGSTTGPADYDRVMTSPDGITWTLRTVPINTQLSDIVFANGVFIIIGILVALSGNLDGILTSTDGTNWTVKQAPDDIQWAGVAYGGGSIIGVSTNTSPGGGMISDKCW